MRIIRNPHFSQRRFGASRSVMPVVCLMTVFGFGEFSLVDAQTALKSALAINKGQPAVAGNKPNKPTPTKFLRVTRDESGQPRAMQTAITRYRPAKGEVVVDLIGAVHIGEGKYYRQLNDQFELYDAVLYELVAPQGTRIPKGGKKPSNGMASPLDLVSWMQGQAKTSLGLQSQLELVDYQKSNFVHADLSPAEMSRKMTERGDTPLTIGLSAITEIMRQQSKADQIGENEAANNPANQLTSANLLELLGDPVKMKLMMAEQFAQTGVMDTGLGATLNQLLISDRNEAAIKVLQKQMAQGETRIAIFYGAAHMPDFEKRLVKNFGMTRTKQVWIDAWDLTKSGQRPKANSTSSMLLELLNELGK